MSWLLKIAEGPMKGAEVALLADTRLKVGSSADCDIVINDASFAPFAFELEVSESTVTLITPDGTQTQMKPFEIRDFGTTAVAIGPADEPWRELVRPAPTEAEPPPERPAPEEVPPAVTEEAEKPERKSRGCLVSLVILSLLLLLLFALAWLFRPQLADARARMFGPAGETSGRAAGGDTSAVRVATLRELAEQHGLRLEKDGEADVLVGNLKRRTERLAIRALALATNPGCRLRLTDDETLLKASNELLFAYTDGALRATAASNGVVSIAGYASEAAALERALKALDADVRGIERVDALGVTVGGQSPVRREPEKVAFCGEPIREEQPVSAKAPKVSRRNYPIAGILTAPYPCVVLRDGHRVMEGAEIGTAQLVEIKSDRLVLKDGGTTFEWKP